MSAPSPASGPPVALALSPHLDDAVFSAGGTLARLARDGWRVVVATIFTASVPEPSGFALACQVDKGLDAATDYMALRRAEDARACREIGATAVWLPFREAPHRGYRSAAALFNGPHADDTVADALGPALRVLLDTWKPALVLAPQAIGGHVDHLALVHALRATEPVLPILWWRDYPYAIRPERSAEPLAATFEPLDAMQTPLDEMSRDAKRQAALSYASQIGFQFGGADALRVRLAEQSFETFRAQGNAAAVIATAGFPPAATGTAVKTFAVATVIPKT